MVQVTDPINIEEILREIEANRKEVREQAARTQERLEALRKRSELVRSFLRRASRA